MPTVTVDTRCARAKRERFPDGGRAEGRFRGASCLVNGGCGEREIFRAGRCRGRREPAPRERGPSRSLLLYFLCSPLSAPGRRTSVSAPLGVHPKTLAPMGRQSAWAGNPNPLTHRHRVERDQNQRRGGADLCVRSAGRSPEDTRTNGQPIRVDRKSQSAHTQTARGKGPEPASRGGGPLCPLRWGFIRGYSHRWVAKEFGPEKSLVMQHKKIARSTAQQHWPVSFLEGELFERPAFAAKRRPQVGAIQKNAEPQPGSLTWESRKPVSSIGLRTPRHDRIPPASHPGGMQEAIPFRDEPIGLSSQPRVVLRTNPGL